MKQKILSNSILSEQNHVINIIRWIHNSKGFGIISKEKWGQLRGKQINLIYNRIKSNSFIINKEDIKIKKDGETANIKLLIDNIQQTLNDYINGGMGYITKNWKDEDKQKLKKYNQIIKKNPKSSQTYFNRGVLFHNRNQLEKALSDYNKVIECNPKNQLAYCNRGEIYYNRNQLDKALSDYTNAITQNPFNPTYHNIRGDIYFKKNMFQEALIDYTKAIECTQKALYYRNRAKVYRKLNMIKQAESDEKKFADLSK